MIEGSSEGVASSLEEEGDEEYVGPLTEGVTKGGTSAMDVPEVLGGTSGIGVGIGEGTGDGIRGGTGVVGG